MLLKWSIYNVFNLICSMMNDYQSFKIRETKSVFYTMTREISLVVCLNLISGISFSIERRAVDWMSTGLPIEGQIGNQASKWRDDRPHSTERLTLNLLSAITQRESWKCAKKIGPIVNHNLKWKWKCKMCNHASKWRDDRPHSTGRLAFNLLLAITQSEIKCWNFAKQWTFCQS